MQKIYWQWEDSLPLLHYLVNLKAHLMLKLHNFILYYLLLESFSQEVNAHIEMIITMCEDHGQLTVHFYCSFARETTEDLNVALTSHRVMSSTSLICFRFKIFAEFEIKSSC